MTACLSEELIHADRRAIDSTGAGAGAGEWAHDQIPLDRAGP